MKITLGKTAQLKMKMNQTILIISSLIGIAFGVSVKFDVCHNQPNGHFFKDYSDCKGYIACVNGFSVYGSCPDKLLFNATTSACDYSELVECNSCPRSGVMTFPIEHSCRKYVRCILGRAEYLECPSNLFYDKTQDGCNIQSKVDCQEQICESFGDYFVGSREDCSVYYQCNRGVPTRAQCHNGLYFNEKLQNCDLPANVQCNIEPPKKPELEDVIVTCPPTGQHFYPHPLDCSYYFICHNGVSALLNCGPILKYDIISQSCNVPENAKCITSI